MAFYLPNLQPLQRFSVTVLSIFLLCTLAFTVQAEVPGDGSKKHPLELGWSNLIPEGFEPEILLKKYEKDLARLEALPDDSDEGLAIIQKIQTEVDMIPANSKLDGKWVKLPGYIAPLQVKNAAIQQFLLVPYFGACIHVPPPPVNQTVLVDILPKQGIRLDQADYPFMVTGKLVLHKTKTDIGSAGYHITQAEVKLHHDTRWLEVEE